MDLKLEMLAQEQFGELAELDRSHGCRLCGGDDLKIAIENMRVLSEWWLSPAQRTALNVETLIQGRQAPDRPSMDAVFKISTPLRRQPIPIFLVICQHQEDKKLPHYQLQAPTGDIKKSLRDLEREIAPLYNQCDVETSQFHPKGQKSISLHERLTSSELETIQWSLSAFIVGIREVLEASAAAGPR
jgi:hypothetical protein